MEYVIYCEDNPCGSASGKFCNDFLDKDWLLKSKPNHGMTINVVFQRLERETIIHFTNKKCGCQFEIQKV